MGEGVEVNKWQGCYEQSWKDVIVPEAFSHPAKMAYGLLSRILTHAQEQGWFTPQSIILDPFGGIGSTGILGAYEGYQVVCVELEAKFVDLAEQNFKLHDNAWQKFGNPRPIVLQGDSRRLVEVVQKADMVLSSPPFLQSEGGKPESSVVNSKDFGQCRPYGIGKQSELNTPGQLGAMKAGDLIISSPPYAESLTGDGTQNETAAESRAKRRTPGGSLGQSQRTQGYGSKQNLGNLKSGDLIVSSPPFMLSDNRNADKTGFAHKFHGDQKYGNENPSMGGMGGDRLSEKAKSARTENVESIKNLGNIVSTGNTGKLINEETFWSAARLIVEQCYQILRPGGHAIWVCKDFVRNKKRVPFSKDWARLCESVGFKLVHWHKATLIKESKHKTLFGHTETKRTARKSFFRRLAEAKGSPRIDEEDILCMESSL